MFSTASWSQRLLRYAEAWWCRACGEPDEIGWEDTPDPKPLVAATAAISVGRFFPARCLPARSSLHLGSAITHGAAARSIRRRRYPVSRRRYHPSRPSPRVSCSYNSAPPKRRPSRLDPGTPPPARTSGSSSVHRGPSRRRRPVERLGVAPRRRRRSERGRGFDVRLRHCPNLRRERFVIRN